MGNHITNKGNSIISSDVMQSRKRKHKRKKHKERTVAPSAAKTTSLLPSSTMTPHLCQRNTSPKSGNNTSRNSESKDRKRRTRSRSRSRSRSSSHERLTCVFRTESQDPIAPTDGSQKTGEEGKKRLMERVCYCLSSPKRIINSLLSVFLYAGTYAVLASGVLGVIGTVLSPIGLVIPALLVTVVVGVAIGTGAIIGMRNALQDRSVLPEDNPHWLELLSKIAFWHRITSTAP